MDQSKKLTCADVIKDALCLAQSGESYLLRAFLFRIQQSQHDDQYTNALIESLLTCNFATIAYQMLGNELVYDWIREFSLPYIDNLEKG